MITWAGFLSETPPAINRGVDLLVLDDAARRASRQVAWVDQFLQAECVSWCPAATLCGLRSYTSTDL